MPTKSYCSKVLNFPKIYITLQCVALTLGGAGVDPTSQFRSSAMLVLPIEGNCKVLFYGRPPMA
jgi:hypothetical protein